MLLIIHTVGLFVLSVSSLRLPVDIHTNFREETTVFVTNKFQLHEIVNDPLPEWIRVQLFVTGQPVTMNLQRNYNVTTNITVFVTNNGAIKPQPLADTSRDGLYFNVEHLASFYVTYTDTEDSEQPAYSMYTLFGSFELDEDDYALQPLPNHNGGIHEVVIPTWNRKSSGGYLDTEMFVPLVDEKHQHKDRTKRDADSPIDDFWIELLLVVDYSLYQIWYKAAPGITHSEKDVSAKQAIRTFYANVVNGVDLRYRSLDVGETFFYLRPLLVGIYIADSQNASSWIEESREVSQHLLASEIDSEQTLHEFSRWLSMNPKLPAHDHAVAFTAYNMVNDDTDIATGISFVGAICTTSSQSLVEDNFNFKVATTVTHELGHSLGANHDGLHGYCKEEEGYIMDPGFYSESKSTVSPYEFSYCSIRSFTEQIHLLDYLDSNCLESRGDSYYSMVNDAPKNISNSSDIHINEYETSELVNYREPDEACKVLMKNNESNACRQKYALDRYSTMCITLWCSVGNKHSFRDYIVCQPVFPPDGLPCGDKKYCVNGKCIESENAKDVEFDHCPIGDQPGPFFKTKYIEITCQRLVRGFRPALCYIWFVERRCCHTCFSNKVTQVESCFYGDTRRSCVTKACARFYPFTKDRTCCKTCLNFAKPEITTSKPNHFTCDGDNPGFTKIVFKRKYSCKALTYELPYLCYNKEIYANCCAGCNWAAKKFKEYKSVTIDCEYRDRIPECISYKCAGYSQAEVKKCCYTCAKGNTGTSKGKKTIGKMRTEDTCEDDAGPQFNLLGCSDLKAANRSLCYNSSIESVCCETCQKLELDLEGCHYGDSNDICDISMCDMDAKGERKICCETCYNQTTPVPAKTRYPTTTLGPNNARQTVYVMRNSAEKVAVMKDWFITVLLVVAVFYQQFP